MNKELFVFPFKSGPMVANFIFALLFWLCITFIGMLGFFGVAVLPALVIFIMFYSHYCLDITLAAGKGRAHKTVFKFSGFRPQYLFFFLCIISLCVFFYLYLGLWVAALLISLFVPASIAAMAVERNFIQALNPINIIAYVKLYQSSILIPIGGIWFFALLLYVMPQQLWLIVQYFVYLTIILWIFYVVGVLLVRPVIENDEEPLSKAARVFVENKAPPKISFSRLTDEWHRLNEVREISKALKSISDFINSQPDHAEAAEQVMQEIFHWRNTRLAYRYLPMYLTFMLNTGKFGLMYKYYRKLCHEHGAIAVTHPVLRENLYQFAESMNDDELIKKLSD